MIAFHQHSNAFFLQLLAPEGGSIVAPVESDLLLLTRNASGALHTRTISQVRFTELEVSVLVVGRFFDACFTRVIVALL